MINNEELFPKKYSKKMIKELSILQKKNRLFITPHIGGSTYEARVKRLKFVLKSFKKELEN